MSGPEHREQRYDVAVVGGGVAGSAVALRAAQYHLRTLWILGDAATAKASRARWVLNIDNMIGLRAEPVLERVGELLAGEEYAAARERLAREHIHIGTQAIIADTRNRVQEEFPEQVRLLDERAVAARPVDGAFELDCAESGTFRAGALVLATGVMDRQPSIKRTLASGRVIDDVRWVYPYANHERLLYCIRCEGHLTRETESAVIGAGPAAVQLALTLHERYGTRVTLLANGEEPRAEPELLRLLDAYGIGVRGERLVDLYEEGPCAGRKGSELHGFVLEGGERVPARFALVAMGLYRVYNELARALGAELEAGERPDQERHVLVEDFTSETSVPGLFAVGDMAQRRDGGPLMKQIYTAQEYAVRAVDTIERRLRAARRAEALGREG